MNLLFTKSEAELNGSEARAKVIVDLIIEKIYPILLTDLEYYQHFRWRLNQLKEFKDGILDESTATRWSRKFLDEIETLAQSDDNEFTKETVFELVITHLESLTRDEVMIKIMALGEGR